MMAGRGGVGQPIGADAVRFRIADPHAPQGFGVQLQAIEAPKRTDRAARERSGARNHAAERRALNGCRPNESLHSFAGRAVEPALGRDVSLFINALPLSQPQVGVRVADVQQEQFGHGEMALGGPFFNRQVAPDDALQVAMLRSHQQGAILSQGFGAAPDLAFA